MSLCRSKAVVGTIILIVGVALAGCGGDEGEPAPGFDVNGVWAEQGGDSTVEFTAGGGYEIEFKPSLSDGTTRFGGESYDRVDNAHLAFTVVMGRASLEIVEVEASINSSEVLKFSLDGRNFKFTKTGD